jgi:NAD(P)-dependent dehydrogenase (short-subunit alcohol dehydrogenase family)
MAKTWLITGSSRGIGRALTEAVLDRGDWVVATARRPERLADLVRLHGDQIRAVPLDVTAAAAARAAVQAALDAFGALDVVVNNAGYAHSLPIEEITDDDFRAQLETNLFGVVNVTRAAQPVLHEQRSGHFIQFSSIGGRVGGTPGMGAYQTAKFGVDGFSRVLDAEVKPLGIKVTIVEPGAFRTEWAATSVDVGPIGEDYEQTVGRMNRYRLSSGGDWPGDPARAAQIIIDVVGLDDPPLHLLLGADALELAGESSRALAAEAGRWAALSRSADFPAGG